MERIDLGEAIVSSGTLKDSMARSASEVMIPALRMLIWPALEAPLWASFGTSIYTEVGNSLGDLLWYNS